MAQYMVQTITPLRISFMGGRSDFPSFYQEEEGFVVASTIDKYIRICIEDRENSIVFSQHGIEEVSNCDELNNHLLKQALKEFKIDRGLKVMAFSDAACGSGLGSSSSFLVGLLQALQYKTRRTKFSKLDLAEMASDLEIDKLRINTGKQDQYCATYGGLNTYRFLTDGKVEVKAVDLSRDVKKDFEASLCLFHTGLNRDSGEILEAERHWSLGAREYVREMKGLAEEFYHFLATSYDLEKLGKILDEGWKRKQKISDKISNDLIQDAYECGMRAGAFGGKLLGAGGGGYLLFICPLEKQLRLEKSLSPLKRLPFKLSDDGVKIL